MNATVTVVGGGYGGTAVAKKLDDVADVVLVEPRDAFFHNVAALRALVDPAWAGRIFLPYDRLLSRGRIVRDRAVRVTPDGVELGSGAWLASDFIVLATGSTYPFPAKLDVDDSAAAKERLRTAHEQLAAADRILLLGAGPVGLELAGEIRAAFPDKAVTIVDRGRDVITGEDFPDEFRAELRRQLAELGVELVLGTTLTVEPVSDPGTFKPFTVTTQSGRTLAADIWFRCFGGSVVTDYLADELAAARQPNGRLDVTPDLRLAGADRVFALGDITAISEAKKAAAASAHAEVVAANIRTLLEAGSSADLATYQPDEPGIVVPLGPSAGASYARKHGGLLDAATTSQLKGADLLVGAFAERLGLVS